MGLRDTKSRGGMYRARDGHVTVAQAYIRASPIADSTSSIFSSYISVPYAVISLPYYIVDLVLLLLHTKLYTQYKLLLLLYIST